MAPEARYNCGRPRRTPDCGTASFTSAAGRWFQVSPSFFGSNLRRAHFQSCWAQQQKPQVLTVTEAWKTELKHLPMRPRRSSRLLPTPWQVALTCVVRPLVAAHLC